MSRGARTKVLLPPSKIMSRLAGRVNGNADLVRRGRFLNVVFAMRLDDVPYYITVRDGRIADLSRGPALLRPWRFAITAPVPSWRKFWQPVPEPCYHDIFAMTKSGEAAIDGDLQPLMANLRYVKEVIATPRSYV